MDCIDKFLEDFHSQQFYNGTLINPTRFFIVAALLLKQPLSARYSKRDIESIIFRYYVDNPSISTRHPRPEIRNLTKYGIAVIKDELNAALDTWHHEATQGSLKSDLKYVYLEIEPEMDYSGDVEYLWMVLEEVYQKSYNMDFPKLLPIEGLDTDLITFGQGVYRSHLMEEIQYCVCCDEYDTKKLYAIHILPDSVASNTDSRESIANGLLMCYEHAQEYLHRRFYFDSNGRIHNISSSIVHKNMRIGQKLLTQERLQYLEQYAAHMNEPKT